MSRRSRLASGLVLLVATLGCGTRKEPAPATSSSLPDGVVARVEGEAVSVSAVELIAERQLLEPRAALSRALSSALFAAAGRATLPGHVPSSIERAAAARSVLERIAADSASAGPPTDAEIAELQRERWAEIDRAQGVRTVHAVAISKDPKLDAAAGALAVKIAAAVKSAVSDDEFISLANAVPAEGLEVKAEALPPITPDGRAFERTEKGFVGSPTSFDHDFSRAANALQQPGDLSPIVKTRFGYHVIRLVERFPASIVPKAEILTAFGPELQTRRAVRLRRELLEKLRSSSVIQVDRAVDELTGRLQPTP